jgi:predicted short-subunit dehydrogenase-like oxidoreductase (DUF2520 family)
MFEHIVVVGAGRAGRPIAQRLGERYDVSTSGHELDCERADLVVVCTPDSAIEQVAQALDVGPWICHVSEATRLDALAPHERRFSVHPLQTLHAEGGAAQLDGTFAAVTAETAPARRAARRLAGDLELTAFPLADDDRPLYHAGATVAASFLVTIQRAAAELLERAGAPREALVPLMTRVVELGFPATGPHVRGDRETIDVHVRAIAERQPELGPLYDSLSGATELLATR